MYIYIYIGHDTTLVFFFGYLAQEMKTLVLNQPRFHVAWDFPGRFSWLYLALAVSNGSWTKVVRKHAEESHADVINNKHTAMDSSQTS